MKIKLTPDTHFVVILTTIDSLKVISNKHDCIFTDVSHATWGFLKITDFWGKVWGVKFSVYNASVTKICDAIYIRDVVMWTKFGN